MKKEDITALAELARIELTEAEIERFSSEFDDILSYVARVKGLAEGLTDAPEAGPIRNVFREDTDPHEAGIYTDALLAAAPDRQGPYVRVKKVIKNDNG